jgi:hypothetical protein
MITVGDLQWTAGFIEGEGCFSYASRNPQVTANQVNPWPLFRLHAIFGGRPPRLQPRKQYHPNWQPIWVWAATGVHAVGVIFSIYPFLSPHRREQAGKVLTKWKAVKAHPRYRTHCSKGHAFADFAIARERGPEGWRYRRCRICSRERGRRNYTTESHRRYKRKYKAKLRVVRSDRQGDLPLSS